MQLPGWRLVIFALTVPCLLRSFCFPKKVVADVEVIVGHAVPCLAGPCFRINRPLSCVFALTVPSSPYPSPVVEILLRTFASSSEKSERLSKKTISLFFTISSRLDMYIASAKGLSETAQYCIVLLFSSNTA